MSALKLIYKDRMTFGSVLPLDRNWSDAGQRRARIAGRPFGVPDKLEIDQSGPASSNVTSHKEPSTLREWSYGSD
ncbi:hypothetical protein [Cohaesibacter celericrescens]|uniref:hypothetical protein n=1 Tax=Cohaesibacter celericrescens TaxID=2067669 RepID=UPI0035618AC6